MNQNNGTENNGVINSTAETLTGKEKRALNLQPLDTVNKDRQREIRSLGGKARQEQIKQRKTMKEQMCALLESKASKELAKKYLGPEAENIPENELTMQAVMLLRMWQEATEKGNARAAEFVRDTSGQRPKDQIELTADIITASDRSLLDNIADRYREKDSENS